MNVLWLSLALAAATATALAAAAGNAAAPRTYRDATPTWPQRERPPARAPNVVFVVLDDIGFAQLGCYGGPIATPNIDRVAAQGLRYTNFHVAPVCSPTRAALLTGRNPHAAGVGVIAEFANGLPNARGGIRPDVPTLAELLRARGYNTMALGKWHLTPMEEIHPAASGDYWPTGRGFERFYGFIGGDTNQWAPELYLNRTRIVPPATLPDGRPYHLDADLTERAIGFVAEQRASAPDRPFFLYLAYCAGHAPHHAPPDFIARYRGKFDAGWDVARAATLERQKQLGLVPRALTLPPPNPGVRQWDELSAEERRLYARYYEVFAGCLEHTDHQLGRLLEYLDRAGVADDTLLVVLSDNGASPEGGPEGLWNEVQLFMAQQPGTLAQGLARLEQLGGPLTYPTYPIGWTQAGSTPWRRTKGTLFEGGIRVPLIVRWPRQIADRGGIRGQFHFATDLAATVLEAAAPAPANADAPTQGGDAPIDGISLAYTWPAANAAAPTRRAVQVFELHGHRALWHEGWKIIAPHAAGQPWENDRWELYHLDADPSESRDLAEAQPQKLAELIARWTHEAERAGIFPLDDRTAARDLLRSPANLARTRATYHPPLAGLHKATALEYRGRSVRITAALGPQERGSDGVLVAQGGRFGGIALYVLNNRLVFHHNWSGLERTTVTATEPLVSTAAAQAQTVAMNFAREPGGSARVALFIDGREAGTGVVPQAFAGNISHEPLDFGRDDYTPVSDDYDSPFAFRGEIREVIIETTPVEQR